MALTPIFGINLESLPKEALSLIEALAQRAQEADRLEQENRLLREMLRLERLKKYGPKSEKLSEEQVELLELEPGVHAQEVEKEAEVSFPAKAPHKARACRAQRPARASAAARGDHYRGRRGEAQARRTSGL
jgi:Transposase C of IS166 homeodomain